MTTTNSDAVLPAQGIEAPRSGRVDPAKNVDFPSVSYNRDWSPRIYRVENPDGIRPGSAQSGILMRYHGNGTPAAVLYNGKGYRVAAFGFPLETSEQMPELLKSTLQILQGR